MNLSLITKKGKRPLTMICTLFSLAIAGNQIPLTAEQTLITELKVQAQSTPLAVEDKNPLFSWQMSSTKNGQKQNAYRVVVARESDKRTVWDSGKIESGI